MSASDTLLRNDQDRAIAALADELAREIGRNAAEHDRAGSFPHDHFALLHRRGVLALTVPERHGGRGISIYQVLLFQERLAKGSGSTALALGWHLMVFGYLGYGLRWSESVLEKLAYDAVEKGWLINVLVTEREAGNLLRGARPGTIARRTDSGWVLNGRKAFCSSAPALQQMIVYAWIEGEERTAEFLVPRAEGVEVIETWNTVGMRSTGSHDIAFTHVQLAPEAFLGYIDIGKRSTFTSGSRIFGLQLAAVYLGIAVAARDEALAFAAGYEAKSLGKSILEAPAVQAKLGEIELLIGASRTLLYGLAERWEQHEDQRERLEHEVSITKVTVTNNAIRIVELAMGIVGGHSLSREHPLERHFRDVQCARFNPPQDDTVLANLAKAAIDAHRAAAAPAAPAAPAAHATDDAATEQKAAPSANTQDRPQVHPQADEATVAA